MKLALFDFDGTITKKDSLAEFIKYAIGKPRYYFGLFLLSPILIAYTLKIVPNHIAKEKLITHFFKDWPEKKFQTVADDYAVNKINDIVRQSAITKIRWHQNEGHKVVIVSASIESWLQKWCENYQIDLIATQLEIKEDKITGKFSSKNCHGKEKINRIKKSYDLTTYSHIYAYGDSTGDKEMLGIADESYYKPFNKIPY